jgi:uncharacterized membrane-anchored protein YhcB (DUF1043 family)
MLEFKSDIKKIIEGDWEEWEKYKQEITKHLAKEEADLKDSIAKWEDKVKKALEDSFEALKDEFKQWLLEELQKDKYRGKPGRDAGIPRNWGGEGLKLISFSKQKKKVGWWFS